MELSLSMHIGIFQNKPLKCSCIGEKRIFRFQDVTALTVGFAVVVEVVAVGAEVVVVVGLAVVVVAGEPVNI